MEKTKVTKKQNFEVIRGILEELGKTDLVAVIDNEINLLNKKAESRKNGDSKVQKENAKIKEVLIEELAKIGTPITITDLLNKSEILQNYVVENSKTGKLTNQKVSALFKQLAENKIITKLVEKGTSYFTIAE